MIIEDNDIDYGEYSEDFEDAQDYYQEHRYSERTRELDGELTWGEE